MSYRSKPKPTTAPDKVACEILMSRLLRREKTPSPTMRREKAATNSMMGRSKSTRKQQNIQVTKGECYKCGMEKKATETATMISSEKKPKNDEDREPWGQVLKNQKTRSSFSNFDPLRTLHFLSRELQQQLQNVAPDDNTLMRMVTDMQHALKRVPPEVASSIHLQQAVDLLPINRRTSSSQSLFDDKPEKLLEKPCSLKKITQTTAPYNDNDKIKKMMEETTTKLESSCRQMELLCSRLKLEKEELEKDLDVEKDSVKFLQNRIDDLEQENKSLLNNRIKPLEAENNELQSKLGDLNEKIALDHGCVTNELKELKDELKRSKASAEKECSKLKHQLKLCCMEKEKYVAVLAVRDRQIIEIRNEMSQLQDVVNEQLLELHKGAFSSIPSNGSLPEGDGWEDYNKENTRGDVGDGTVGLHNEPQDNNCLFREIPSGDSGVLHEMSLNDSKSKKYELQAKESQHSIKEMFGEIRRQALAVKGRNFSRKN